MTVLLPTSHRSDDRRPTRSTRSKRMWPTVAKASASALGGSRIGTTGTFFEPTVLTGISHDMRIAQEETFGPIAPIIRFETAEQVVAERNDTIYRSRCLFLRREPQAGLACRRGSGIRHGRHQYGPHVF